MSEAAGRAIVRVRQMANISRREMTQRARTSPAALASYERGTVSPDVDTFGPIMASVFTHRRRWASLGDLAAAVAGALERGEAAWAWRMCTEVFDDEHAGSAEETILFASRYPDPTGNSWADAMVAALGEWICVQRGLATPPWTLETRVACPFWIVNRLFAATALRETPPSFSSRWIFLTRRDLAVA